MKCCLKCGADKSEKDFSRDKYKSDGLRIYCKTCSKEHETAYRKQHIDELREKRRERRRQDKNGMKERERIKAKEIRSSASGTINHRISVNIGQSLRGSNKAGRKWQSLVGYTLADLKRNLEKKFLPGMTWENREQWHIDHKTPISAFNFTRPEDIDFQKCWSLENLRPMWAEDNISKHDHVDKPFQPSLTI